MQRAREGFGCGDGKIRPVTAAQHGHPGERRLGPPARAGTRLTNRAQRQKARSGVQCARQGALVVRGSQTEGGEQVLHTVAIPFRIDGSARHGTVRDEQLQGPGGVAERVNRDAAADSIAGGQQRREIQSYARKRGIVEPIAGALHATQQRGKPALDGGQMAQDIGHRTPFIGRSGDAREPNPRGLRPRARCDGRRVPRRSRRLRGRHRGSRAG